MSVLLYIGYFGVTHLLHDTTTIRVQCIVEHPPSECVGKLLLLQLVSMFKELLDDIVSKDADTQLRGAGKQLGKDSRLFFAIGSLQLFLDES